MSNPSFSCQNSSINHKKLKQIKFLLIVTGFSLIASTAKANKIKNPDIDFLILSTRWFPSACISYKDKRPSNFCTFLENPNVWVLHGLWPQKGPIPGPFFCNPQLKFDVDALEPILSDLITYWPNIYGNEREDSLWHHEWDKHGTCAVGLEPLFDQIHFFNATVELFKQHNMNSYFNTLKIYPSSSSGIYVADLNARLTRLFGKSMRIKCSNARGEAYLTEVRACFSTELEKIDCPNYESYTNCPTTTPIKYPDNVNDVPKPACTSKLKEEARNYYGRLNYILKIIQFLQWVFI